MSDKDKVEFKNPVTSGENNYKEDIIYFNPHPGRYTIKGTFRGQVYTVRCKDDKLDHAFNDNGFCLDCGCRLEGPWKVTPFNEPEKS